LKKTRYSLFDYNYNKFFKMMVLGFFLVMSNHRENARVLALGGFSYRIPFTFIYKLISPFRTSIINLSHFDITSFFGEKNEKKKS